MTFEEFKAKAADEILGALPPEFGGAEIDFQEIRKPGRTYTGMAVCVKRGEPTPLIDLDMFYEMLQDGREYREVLEVMAETAMIRPPASCFGMPENYDDYTFVKERLMVRLCNAERDGEYIKELPHLRTADLAMTCHIAFLLPNGSLSAVPVTKDMLKTFGISEEELLEDALANSRELFPERIRSLEMMLAGLSETEYPDDMDCEPGGGIDHGPDGGIDCEPGECPSALVLTTRGMLNGAAALFYPGVMEKLAAYAGGDYYVLPSSIHELIILPASVTTDIDALRETVKMANATCVPPEEVLSDHVYIYSAEEGTFGCLPDTGLKRRENKGFS